MVISLTTKDGKLIELKERPDIGVEMKVYDGGFVATIELTRHGRDQLVKALEVL